MNAIPVPARDTRKVDFEAAKRRKRIRRHGDLARRPRDTGRLKAVVVVGTTLDPYRPPDVRIDYLSSIDASWRPRLPLYHFRTAKYFP